MTEDPVNSLSGLTVLVTEDDLFAAMDLAEELEAARAIVLGPISSVEKAMKLLNVEHVDAAVLDIRLRSELAFPLADLLTEKRVPFLFASGCDPADIPEAHAGIHLCAKPIAPGKIVAALASLIQAKAA